MTKKSSPNSSKNKCFHSNQSLMIFFSILPALYSNIVVVVFFLLNGTNYKRTNEKTTVYVEGLSSNRDALECAKAIKAQKCSKQTRNDINK